MLILNKEWNILIIIIKDKCNDGKSTVSRIASLKMKNPQNKVTWKKNP